MRVPFPLIERPVMVPRPALVISRQPLGPGQTLIWTLMITNRLRPAWSGDVAIENAEQYGLLIPSKVRTAKVATADVSSAVRLGDLDASTLARVMELVDAACG